MLAFCDLDNTLIYHSKKFHGAGIPVCSYTSGYSSYISLEAADLLRTLPDSVTFVPTTSRSVRSYCEIWFPDVTPKYALVSNGGNLLIDGKADRAWLKETEQLVAGDLQLLRKMAEHLGGRANMVDDLYLMIRNPEEEAVMEYVREAAKEASLIVYDGRKPFVLPVSLEKGVAVQRFKKRFHTGEFTVAAGDSAFDVSMLREVDVSIAPEELKRRLNLGRQCIGINESFAEGVLRKFHEMGCKNV